MLTLYSNPIVVHFAESKWHVVFVERRYGVLRMLLENTGYNLSFFSAVYDGQVSAFGQADLVSPWPRHWFRMEFVAFTRSFIILIFCKLIFNSVYKNLNHTYVLWTNTAHQSVSASTINAVKLNSNIVYFIFPKVS